MDNRFLEYHESITKELLAIKDRVRVLVPHWGEDGRNKETILRKVLRNHIPENFQIGTGFVVCSPDDPTQTTSQIDILITTAQRATLFKEGEMRIVTPDAVGAIVEVKAGLRGGRKNLNEIFTKLADDAEKIRSIKPDCLVGLFAYENGIEMRCVLEEIKRASKGQENRVINLVACGGNSFVRYWNRGKAVGSVITGSVWHTYKIPGLAFPYFINNIVGNLSRGFDPNTESTWFPIEGGKEGRRELYASLKGAKIGEFFRHRHSFD